MIGTMKAAPNAPCPCQSGRKYKRCCRPLHRGAPAPSPEALMRSRYAAYALGIPDYIIRTTHPDGPVWERDRDAWQRSIEAFSTSCSFDGLTILDSSARGDRGEVHFRAQLDDQGTDRSFAERSLFYRHDGRWKYHSGEPTG